MTTSMYKDINLGSARVIAESIEVVGRLELDIDIEYEECYSMTLYTKQGNLRVVPTEEGYLKFQACKDLIRNSLSLEDQISELTEDQRKQVQEFINNTLGN